MVIAKEVSLDDNTGEKILERLQAALRSDGDFPIRAKVVSELRLRASNPSTTVEQMASLILKEPALGTRILHLVNSSFYLRARPVDTISQAVLRIGMTAISDLCAGLVVMQRFVPAARRGGVFANCVKRSVVTALLSNELARLSNDQEVAEKGYLAGTFYHLGHLLLAFYFPQIYEAAEKRGEIRGYGITRSISELLGKSPVELVLGIVDALKIPPLYHAILEEAHRSTESGELSTVQIGRALRAAGSLSEAIVDGKTVEALEDELTRIAQESGYPREVLCEILSRLPEAFSEHCKFIDLSFLTLPPYLSHFSGASATPFGEGEAQVSEALRDIQDAVEQGEPLSSILGLVMEACTGALGYDRTLLLYLDRDHRELQGRTALGERFPFDPRRIVRPLSDVRRELPDVEAFRSGKPQTTGEPLCHDTDHFFALPIGRRDGAKGVIYADRIRKPGEGVRSSEQASHPVLCRLTDLLDQAVLKSEDW